MAIRERKNRPLPFQVYWNNPFTSKRESSSFKTLPEAKRHDSYIKHRLKHERDSFRPAESDGQKPGEALTVEGVCWLYIRGKRFEGEALERAIVSLRVILILMGNITVADLTKRHVLQAIATMTDVKQPTIARRFAVLKAALNWCEEQEIIPSNPIARVRVPVGHASQTPPPTIEEAGLIYQHAAPHMQRVVMLGIYCGMRVGPSEMLKLTWADVDFTRNIIRVWSAKKNMNMQWRDVPIRPTMLPLMLAWKAEDDAKGIPWLVSFHGKPITSSVYRAWHKACGRAGITRRMRAYDLRHAFATLALEAGSDIKAVAEIMGHANASMILKHYQHVFEHQRRATVESIPEILGTCSGHIIRHDLATIPCAQQ